MRQIRRPRPSLQAAHEYHQQGTHGTGPEHYVANVERQKFADEMARRLESLVQEHYPRSANLEIAILKAHLIVEYAITQFICGMSAVIVEHDFIQKKFNFLQKLDVAFLIGFGVNDPLLIPSIEVLNQIRNQVAHKFSVDKGKLDELLRLYSEDYQDFEVATDRERVRQLRWICIFIVGYISGRLAAHVYTLDSNVLPA